MTLTDKDKLNIIDNFKKQIELANQMRRDNPNSTIISPMLQFKKSEFNEMDRIWLTEILDHLGVKHEYV